MALQMYPMSQPLLCHFWVNRSELGKGNTHLPLIFTRCFIACRNQRLLTVWVKYWYLGPTVFFLFSDRLRAIIRDKWLFSFWRQYGMIHLKLVYEVVFWYWEKNGFVSKPALHRWGNETRKYDKSRPGARFSEVPKGPEEPFVKLRLALSVKLFFFLCCKGNKV